MLYALMIYVYIYIYIYSYWIFKIIIEKYESIDIKLEVQQDNVSKGKYSKTLRKEGNIFIGFSYFQVLKILEFSNFTWMQEKQF